MQTHTCLCCILFSAWYKMNTNKRLSLRPCIIQSAGSPHEVLVNETNSDKQCRERDEERGPNPILKECYKMMSQQSWTSMKVN